MNTGLDEDETKFGVLVLSVALKMLANSNGLVAHIVSARMISGRAYCIPS